MRFGAHYLPTWVPELDGDSHAFYEHMFAQMEELDRLGFDDVWVTEHHFHEYGGTISHPPTFMAAVARVTRRIHLGIAVSVLPLHNPLEVAEAYAIVDVISNGRLEFGVGRGSTMPEFASFRVSYEDSPVRMREATEIIQRGWSEETVTFHGELFDYVDVRVLPRPVQRPHPPIWVGASRSDDTFRWAGLQGFHLLTLPYMYEPPVLRRAIEIYLDALVEGGHDPTTREILGKFHVYVADTEAAAEEEALPYLANYRNLANERNPRSRLGPGNAENWRAEVTKGNVIAGEPQHCIEIIERWREWLGLTAISGTFHFGGMPHEMALRNIRLFAERVMPAFDRSPVAVRAAGP